MRTKALAAILVAASLAFGACAAESKPAPETKRQKQETAKEPEFGHGSGDEAFAFGEPADASDATKTVKVTIGDGLAFEPASLEVGKGTVVAFEVANDSKVDHEFVLGDEDVQKNHSDMMSSMSEHGDMEDEPNAVMLPPGAEKTIVWRFSEPGTFEFACHVAGHYEAGMAGTVSVS